MVLKNPSVLWCLLPARLGFGSNHRPDSPSRTRCPKNHARSLPHDPLGDPEFDPFRDNSLLPATDTDPPEPFRARANTAPSGSLSPPPLIPDGGIGESPNPAIRSLSPPVRPKRSSFTTFFAFSSKGKSTQGAPIVHLPQLQQDLVPSQSVPGKWVSDRGQSQVHLINPSSIPSPLRANDDENYYAYYASVTPTFPSHTPSPNPDPTNVSPSKRLSFRQQNDLDSQPSSPVDPHPSHTQLHHPYAYSAPYSKPSIGTSPPLRHATSQPFQHHPQGSRSDINARPPHQHGHESHPHLLQPRLRTSISTPNFASGTPPARLRSLLKKNPPTRSKERWLSTETWWDALLSPSPRFKVKQTPRPHTATGRSIHEPVRTPVQGDPHRNLGVSFPSVPALRPRAISTTSVISNTKPTLYPLSRSRSTADILGQPSMSATPRAGFEPALETLVDERTPTPDQVPCSDTPLPMPDPPLSLEQVIDDGEAFDQQRAQWKKQATRSIGNKHTRSLSRARSKSLNEKHARGHHTLESSKAQFNLEFLAARTLLGNQSTMPTITKPSGSSSHSKAYSHSHSQSAYSYTHASHSQGYSHSHSHSLTTSNSSKSSRNLPPRGHSRTGSWSKTAFLKAGSLCGVVQDESYIISADEKVPSSSRVDVQDTVHLGNAMGASDTAKAHSPPCVLGSEVGIAITSSPTPEGCLGMTGPRHQEKDRCSSKHTHKSSVYAGPHPSVIDSNLPQLAVASDVSLRHRLPPRAGIHPPIAPIAHPYRSASVQPESAGDKPSEGATLKVTGSQEATEPCTASASNPHISLSHADFERYGVGEALVYASLPHSDKAPEAKRASVESGSSPAAELPPSQEQSPLCETVVLPSGEPDASSSAMNSSPSLTNSTIQMVMSAFDNPDDLDEFQDLFYKPFPTSRDPYQESSVTLNQAPTDIHSSASNSPLTHLVRKLSEEVHGRRDPSRTPSDSIRHQRSEFQDHPLSESGTKFVFTDFARSSSSPPSMQSSSQSHVPIQSESAAQPVTVIPEDVDSSYTASVLESPWAEHENDTFGYPIRHGQFEAATSPSPVQSPLRLSTHLSIQEEDQVEEDDAAFPSPARKRFGLISLDVARSSYLTTSDMSQMSGLSDFPLPPTARPGHTSILQTYFEGTPSSSDSHSHGEHEDGAGMEQVDDQGDAGPSGDVGETLRVLRMEPRVTSYDSRRTTFGGSEDMDFITQLHEARP